MAKVIIAVGSNLGDRLEHLKNARDFCAGISSTDSEMKLSSVYESEPIGPADQPFLNAALVIKTDSSPTELLRLLKQHEKKAGRNFEATRWSNRPVDLDIIAWDAITLQTPELSIPHLSYAERLFVLLPMAEIVPEWTDPDSGKNIDALIKKAPNLRVYKTSLKW